MSHERITEDDVTPEQLEAADFFISDLGLEEIADTEIRAWGQVSTLRLGMARSSEHLKLLTRDEIRDMVMTIVKESQESV